VGGDAVLAAMAEQLAHGSLLTLTGSGGVGKTRLAIEYARGHLDEFESGAVLVDLAAITGDGVVADAIAAALSVYSGSSGTPLELLVDWVADRELLLVIDNCEHLLTEVGDTLDALTGRCPRLKVLATSREAVGVPGERVLRVPSLDPVTDATDLFLQRARAADTSFAVDGHRDTVVQICTRLDGIPLAIELAAARVRSLSPPDLLLRLEDRFRLLRGSGRGTLDRHQTLRAMVSWSYQLLQPVEQVLFDRLSVFAGGFDLRAAEAVCGFDPIDELDVLDLLGSLVDKSMVVAEHGVAGSRYRLLETMRQFGEERLEVTPDVADVRGRHLRHFAQVADELWTMVTGADQIDGARRTAEEWDNLRAAHQWALAEEDLPTAEFLVRSTYDFAQLRIRHEHGAMAQRTAELADSLGTPSTLMLGLWAQWSGMKGDLESMVRIARRGLDAAPALDHPTTAFCWNNVLGEPSTFDDDDPMVAATLRNMRRAVETEPDQDRHWINWVDLVDTAMVLDGDLVPEMLTHLGVLVDRLRSPRLQFFVLHFRAGRDVIGGRPEDFATAEALYTRCYELARQTDDVQMTALMMRSFAMVAAGTDRADALARCGEALELLYDLRYWQKVWQVLDSTALALATVGGTERAALIVGFLEGRGLGFGYEHVLGYRGRTKALLPDDAAHRTALADGARLQPDELVRSAIEWCAATEAAAA
jgi:predicted ATPase